jgi:hypothetical protein
LNYQAAADELCLPLGTLKRLQTGALRVLRDSLGVVRNVRGKAGAAERAAAGASAAAQVDPGRDRQESPS